MFAMDDRGAYWLDTGTPEAFLRAQLDIIDGRYRGEGTDTAVAVDGCAKVAATATVDRSLLGPGVVVADAAEVVGSVVMAGARIGRKATVRDSIVGPDARIGAGAHVTELSVLGQGATVAADEITHGARIPEEDA